MVAIGRGLASSPKLLLLDEPSMGLAPMLADMIFERIEEIHRETGLTILLVEQRVVEALRAATAATCSRRGASCWRARTTCCWRMTRVKQAYLGM